MTDLLTRKRPEARAVIDFTAPPGVNLLPPEVVVKRTLSRLKRVLAVVVVGALLVAALGMAWATIRRADAQERLDTANARTEALTTELASYQEVTVVLDELSSVRAAIQLGTSTEVDWRAFVRSLATKMPEGVTLDEVVVVAGTPVAANAAPTDPLVEQSLATVSFVARAGVVPDVTGLLDNLATLPGAQSPTATAVAMTGEPAYGTYYRVEGRVQVDDTVLLGRFAHLTEDAS